jgi:hypothetical protein
VISDGIGIDAGTASSRLTSDLSAASIKWMHTLLIQVGSALVVESQTQCYPMKRVLGFGWWFAARQSSDRWGGWQAAHGWSVVILCRHVSVGRARGSDLAEIDFEGERR